MIKNILQILLVFLAVSCQDKPMDDFEKLAPSDTKLASPKAGEWLAEHPEKGQTFEQYVKLNTLKPNRVKNKIYILPIGGFTSQEDSIVNLTVEYLKIFYDIETLKMNRIKDNIVPKDMRRLNEVGDEQLNADYLIKKVIPNFKPKDALAIMAITGRDLYPKPSWNFVFGLATYSEGIGVTSLARYEPNNKDFALGLGRTIKTSAHEIGHMFKLKHCINAVCVMNGVNSLSEDDRKPNSLCSLCLKKMTLNFGFNNKERFKKLIAFYQKYNLKSDLKIIEEQYKIISN